MRVRKGLSIDSRYRLVSNSYLYTFLGASRPIRRGKIFSNNQPNKKSFFRHFKKLQMSLIFHQLQLDYWTSASMTKGVQVNIAKGLSLSSEYSLKLVSVNDGLIHRPRSNWTIEYTNCQVCIASNYKVSCLFLSYF